MHPRAIETRYKGYRFRSRLEARWAVFFDALGLRWEYEPEGFELPGGVRYLPDFRIRGVFGNHDVWVEIKGAPAGVGDMQKVKLLSRTAPVVLCTGLPGDDVVKAFFAGQEANCEIYVFDANGRDADLAAVAARSARFEHGESGPRGGRQA